MLEETEKGDSQGGEIEWRGLGHKDGLRWRVGKPSGSAAMFSSLSPNSPLLSSPSSLDFCLSPSAVACPWLSLSAALILSLQNSLGPFLSKKAESLGE